MRAINSALLLASLLAGHSMAADVPGWQTVQYKAGGSGCSAKHPGEQIYTFVAFVKDERLTLIAARPEWQVGKDKFIAATITIDDDKAMSVDVLLDGNLVVYMPIDTTIEQRVLKAKSLRWHFPWGDYTADVTGMFDAAQAVHQCNNARAPSFDGFAVGAAAAAQMASRPKPQREGAVGDNRVEAWDLWRGLTLSMTWSPASGKIVFVEKDWAKGSPIAESGVPGLTFGVTQLSEIRQRFGSNGFGFRSNVVQEIKNGIAFANCFEIAGQNDLVLVVVTAVHDDQLEEFKQHPDTGRGTLETVMLADRNYLRSLWGAEMQPDPKYHPIEWR